MKNFIKLFVALFALTLSISSCTVIDTPVGEEAVVVDYPWIFGSGGIREKTYETGLQYTWCSAKVHYFKIIPVQYNEDFDDIFTTSNTPLDFHSYIRIQIKEGKSWELFRNYGEDWYKNNIQVCYRNYTREEISKYSPFDLVSNREVLNRIDSVVMAKMIKHINELSKDKEMPINICSVVTGAASPNKDQLAEMNRTAALIQKKESEERAKEAELARMEAEVARAQADKAYMNEMNLTASQYIQLKAWEIIEKKNGANIDVLFDGSSDRMWNVKRN